MQRIPETRAEAESAVEAAIDALLARSGGEVERDPVAYARAFRPLACFLYREEILARQPFPRDEQAIVRGLQDAASRSVDAIVSPEAVDPLTPDVPYDEWWRLAPAGFKKLTFTERNRIRDLFCRFLVEQELPYWLRRLKSQSAPEHAGTVEEHSPAVTASSELEDRRCLALEISTPAYQAPMNATELPKLAERFVRLHRLRFKKLIEKHGFGGDHLKWHESRDRRRAAARPRYSLTPPPPRDLSSGRWSDGVTYYGSDGKPIPFEAWKEQQMAAWAAREGDPKVVDSIGINDTAALAKARFEGIVGDYLSLWAETDGDSDKFTQWLEGIEQLVEREVGDLWNTEWHAAWFNRACRKEVAEQLLPLVKEWKFRSSALEIQHLENPHLGLQSLLKASGDLNMAATLQQSEQTVETAQRILDALRSTKAASPSGAEPLPPASSASGIVSVPPVFDLASFEAPMRKGQQPLDRPAPGRQGSQAYWDAFDEFVEKRRQQTLAELPLQSAYVDRNPDDVYREIERKQRAEVAARTAEGKNSQIYRAGVPERGGDESLQLEAAPPSPNDEDKEKAPRRPTWDEVEIFIPNDFEAQIVFPGCPPRTIGFEQMGFADGRGKTAKKPNKQWELLLNFAGLKGRIENARQAGLPASEWKTVEQRVGALNRALKRCFKIPGNPIRLVDKGYQSTLKKISANPLSEI
jgi:hypothetical protein